MTVHSGDQVKFKWGTTTVPGKVLSVRKLGKFHSARVRLSVLGISQEEIDTFEATIPVEQLEAFTPLP